MKKFRTEYILVLILFFATLCIVFFYFYTTHHSNKLKVAFLDIGQGDSIYVEAPNGVQMLIDSGKSSKVLNELGKVMPFGDKTIDMIVITNPDADHMGGFIPVLENYKVGMVLEPGTYSPTKTYAKLEQSIYEHNVKKVIARRGMKVLLDKEKNIYFDILFPDRDVSGWSRNDGSIVGKMVYNKESFMMMGDATSYTESVILKNESQETLKSNVLKLGHHGSRTSTSYSWLKAVSPQLGVISAGLHNSYGHPHKEVLDRLSNFNIPYLGTYQKGLILCTTEGLTLSCN